MPVWAQHTFEHLLDGLGVDERALTEGYGKHRAQVNLDFAAPERHALDDIAFACGLGGEHREAQRTASSKLARLVVRSWLAHGWNYPRELEDFDFGEGHRWADSLKDIKAASEWTEGATGPEPVFATLIGRLEGPDLLGVALGLVAQLSLEDREALRRALG